jgi:hypothetical protein
VFFKDADGNLVKAGPVHVGTTAPNATPASGGQAGNSKGELWLDTTGSDYTLKTWDGSAWREIVVTSAMIKDGTIVNADINASAAIVDTKLATISTAGKVSNSATTATNANTASAIVARDGSGNFSAGTVTASLTGAASLNVLKAGDTMTGVLAVTAGTAALPAITPSGDPNTGIFSPGADQLAISTNGTGRLFVDASGNVGITSGSVQSLGVTYSTLEIKGKSGGFGGGIILSPSDAASAPAVWYYDGNCNFGSLNSTPISFLANGSERMRLDSSGRLGLGTSSPSAALHVVTSGAGQIRYFDGTVTGAFGSFGSGNEVFLGSGKALAFTTNGITSSETRMTIDTTGRVGIGTTTVDDLLHIKQDVSGGATRLQVHNGFGASNTTTEVLFNCGSARANIAGLIAGSNENSGLALTFGVSASATTPTERMRLDQSGRLLVGTSSTATAGTADSALVQVKGATGGALDGRFALLRNEAATTIGSGENIGIITFGDSSGNEFARVTCTADADAGSGDYPGRLVFSSTPSGSATPVERMRIQSDGNISIGSGASTSYRCSLTVASGADRDIFLGGISGASNGFQVNWLHATTALSVKFNSITTTASAANAFLDSADGNRIYRSTSSLRYKKDIEDIDQLKADAVLDLRPVWYRSKAADDRSDWSWYGLIAEEVAAVEPRLVHWTYLDEDYEVEEVNGSIKKTLKPDAELVPDGVQYDRLTVLLLDVVKRQNERIETLEAKVAALEAL